MSVGLRSHDQGFVGAPPGDVYRLLADPASYPGWWPRARLEGASLVLPLGSAGAVAPERHRDDIGLHLVGPGAQLEWYLEPFDDGSIVNAFLEVPGSGRRAARRLLRMRGAIRTGLVGLHARLGGAT